MTPFLACFEYMQKTALLERLVRLGATPIPGTPHLVMKSRSPTELRALQTAVDDQWSRHVTKPILGALNKPISKVPSPMLQKGLHRVASEVAKDPLMAGMLAAPIPGAALAYKGVKRGLESAIDHLAPLR